MPDKHDFWEMIELAKKELKTQAQFQEPSWKWVHELDEEGFFIFCYLINDLNQDVLSREMLEETVYTLVMLRHKFLPDHIKEKYALNSRWQLQILFNLYEKLKHHEMSWDLCQRFVDEQLEEFVMTTRNTN
ncbi:MAG: hypothetical protein HQM12_02630 [SAR324 cluster bacterium]|nr:hypothetical protein [SAR324 cluster bacterium]MBF0350082.1 hypothetical protein [SAR324 cluster bacterium]